MRLRQAGRAEHLRPQRQRHVEQVAFRAAGERPDGLLHLERVAHLVAQRLLHAGDQRAEPAAGHRADFDHFLGQANRVLLCLHQRALAGLHVQHHRVAAGGNLLGQDRGHDQRHAVHRRGHVAQGVERLVGGRQIGRLSDDCQADVGYLADELFLGQVDPHARNALQLIQRAAGVAQAAAAHLGHFEPARRG